jgi:hypothetical protein
VFIALAGRRGPEVRQANYGWYDREAFKFVVTQTALDMVRRELAVGQASRPTESTSKRKSSRVRRS